MRKRTALMMLALILVSSVQGQVPNAPVVPKQEGKPQPAQQVPAGVHELTPADIEAFLDGVVPAQLKQNDVAGATISIVKDGKLLFARGYGYADVEKKKTVSPEETMFRPGSISKLFTWTSVMQLYEQGKLDLQRDVNAYLDFKIPDAFGKPITLKDIMTHTPGFEEQIKDLFAPSTTPPALGDYLKTHIPKRIFPPGTVPAYSNYATALAGYIVERVSGRPFNEYVDENIFKPLGMTHSTFAQPLPQQLAPYMSNGYQLGSDPAKPFEVITPGPAGSLSSSATDMAQFMIAHLQNGQLGNARILKPETAQLMHSRLFALDDAANAMCHGFYEESKNGHRIIGHGGDTVYFHSDLHLVLDSGLGFFVSYNSAGRGQASLRTLLWDAFLDRYYPFTPQSTATLSNANDQIKAASGTYMLSRRSDSFLKVASLIGEFNVSEGSDGTLQVAELTQPNGKPEKWKPIAPGTFVDDEGKNKLIFKADQSGRMQMVLPYPFFIGQRVGLFENKRALLPVLGVSLGIIALTLLLWPIAWCVRRYYGRKLELNGLEKLLRFGVRLVFLLDVIFVVALGALATYGFSHLEVFSSRGTIWFQVIQVVGVAGAVGTVLVLLNAAQAWISKRRRIWGKLQATIFLLACIGLLWFSFASNLLNIRSNY